MKFDRFDVTVWGVLGFLVLALLAVIGLGNQIGARVIRAFPESGAEVGGGTRVGIEFAQPMQARTVEAHFEIEPTVSGRFEWTGRTAWFVPARPFQPGVPYTARLRAGSVSQGGQTVRRDVAWQFRARAPWVVYISPANGPRQVWRAPVTGVAPQQLTDVGTNVYDLAVSTADGQIAYSVVNDARGTDLWVMDADGGGQRLLVACGAGLCSTPAWSPDGTRIAYSRESEGLAPDAPTGPPRVWVVDAATGQTAPVYADSQVLGFGPSWSPDGSRLAAVDGSTSSIRVLDLKTSEEMLLPTLMGAMGAWSPDSHQMLYNTLTLAEQRPLISLHLADLTTQQIELVLEPSSADYGYPAWSPTGDWVVVSVRLPDSGPSRQLWLMRPDGSEGRPIVNDPRYTHSAYSWDPWGDALVFQRFEAQTPFPVPQVVVWHMATGESTLLAQDATQAVWQP
jgi:TolB protein